jgi:hypothetical protein
LALIKVDEMSGELEAKTGRELNYKAFQPEDQLNGTLRSVVRMVCGTCDEVLKFYNFVPVLQGEGATPCPVCTGPLVGEE